MTLDNDKARELFNAARNLPSAEREPFLDKECGDDDSLRDEVEALLSHYLTSANTEDSGDGGGSTIDYEVGDTIGKFKIIGVLGEGGMGIVYLAEQSKPVRRRVALKVIKAGMDTKQVIARFEAERQALAMMNHPGIAQVYEAGATEQGRPYFVLEFVKGMAITEACDEHKLDTKQRLELLAKVCDAVQHAHTKGIIHRDLKPSNILVSIGENDVLEPKIIDFGVAKATNQQLTDKTLVTQVGRFIGTPAYMSPEQADLKATDIDTRTDIYALGVITYEVLTGFPPFDPQTLREAGLEKMREIISTQPPLKPSTQLSSIGDEDAIKIADTHRIQIRELAGLLRKELEWIPLKALRKRRSERYDSAKSMGDDIRRYLVGEALEAGPESTIYRFKKTLRKHSVVSYALLAFALITFVAIIAVAYLTLVIYRERAWYEAWSSWNDIGMSSMYENPDYVEMIDEAFSHELVYNLGFTKTLSTIFFWFNSVASTVLVLVSSLWVVVDSKRHKVPKKNSSFRITGFLKNKRGNPLYSRFTHIDHGLTVLVLWIICFPAYLINRARHLKQQGKNYVPMTVFWVGFIIAALLLWSLSILDEVFSLDTY